VDSPAYVPPPPPPAGSVDSPASASFDSPDNSD
jgi:hypothetical protein